MADLLQHEIDRIRTMTDKQLHVRYDKMKRRDKIQAFFEALKMENRAPQLRQKIGVRLGYSLKESHSDGPAVWYLQKGFYDSMIRFSKTNTGCHIRTQIQICKTNTAGDWLIDMTDYPDGCYSEDEGRKKWDAFIEKGYVLVKE